jgi:hypothetical protein
MNPHAVLVATEFACASLAFSASIEAGLDDVSIYNGIDSDTKVAPAVICSATQASEMYKDTGTYKISTSIKVKEMASGSVSDLGAVIFAAFGDGNFINNLNNQSADFVAIDVLDTSYNNTEEGKAWVQTLSFDLVGGLVAQQ